MDGIVSNKKPWQQLDLFSLPYSQCLTAVSYAIPEEVTADEWLEIGRALGRLRGSTMWWIGDWWAFGEHRYGERASAVRSEGWEGPAYQTCVDAAVVCRRFETKSRDLVVSYRAHRVITPIDDEATRLGVLRWAAENHPTIKELEAKVKEARAFLAQGWTPDQLDRKARAEAGQCVVANFREGDDGRRIDEALLAWADANDRFVRIDRQTKWGNPFEMPDDGERDEVVEKFAKFYLPHKDGLLSAIPKLRGKVLGCWCHPAECHGHIIAEIVNDEANGKGSATKLADMRAEIDG